MLTIRYSCLMLLIAVPLWITEIAPPASRGVMCNIHAVCATLGYLLAAICGLGFCKTCFGPRVSVSSCVADAISQTTIRMGQAISGELHLRLAACFR